MGQGASPAPPEKEVNNMRYEITFNPVRKLFCIWACGNQGAELVKTFKTENAARRWINGRG